MSNFFNFSYSFISLYPFKHWCYRVFGLVKFGKLWAPKSSTNESSDCIIIFPPMRRELMKLNKGSCLHLVWFLITYYQEYSERSCGVLRDVFNFELFTCFVNSVSPRFLVVKLAFVLALLPRCSWYAPDMMLFRLRIDTGCSPARRSMFTSSKLDFQRNFFT